MAVLAGIEKQYWIEIALTPATVINVNRAKLPVPPRRLLLRLGGVTIAAALVCSTGCDKEDTVRVYDAPKDAAPAAALPMAAAKPIDFSTAQGWVESEPSSMEYAHFRISPDDPKAAVTVSMLATQAGLQLPNVNRWQRQLKLPESPESDLPNLVKDIDLPGGRGQLVDLTGPEPAAGAGARQRTVAVILPHGSQTWYLKLAGPATLVEMQRSNFDEFLKSVKFPADGDSSTDSSAGTASPPPHPTTEPSLPSEKLAKWNAPPDWKPQEISAASPRLLSFKVGSAEKPGEQADVAVTRMAVDNLDVLLQDINIWRGQVGLPAQDDKRNTDAPQKVSLNGGKEALMFDFAGPKADKPERRVMVALVVRGRDLWFFKILGPADFVAAQKAGFVSFVQSAEFAPE